MTNSGARKLVSLSKRLFGNSPSTSMSDRMGQGFSHSLFSKELN